MKRKEKETSGCANSRYEVAGAARARLVWVASPLSPAPTGEERWKTTTINLTQRLLVSIGSQVYDAYAYIESKTFLS